MRMSPLFNSGSSLAIVSSTGLPCGTMIQIALRPVNFFAMSSSEETPTLPDAVSFATASALKSNPITWWPPNRSRSAMLPPILPRPINPSCISQLPSSRQKTLSDSKSRRRLSALLKQRPFMPAASAPATFSCRSSMSRTRSAGRPRISRARRYIACSGLRKPT